MAAFLEGLTATHDATFFLEEAERLGNPIRTTIRGSLLNHGSALRAVHPVIRTNREFAKTSVDLLLTRTSGDWMEECLCQQGFYTPNQWSDKGRV